MSIPDYDAEAPSGATTRLAWIAVMLGLFWTLFNVILVDRLVSAYRPMTSLPCFDSVSLSLTGSSLRDSAGISPLPGSGSSMDLAPLRNTRAERVINTTFPRGDRDLSVVSRLISSGLLIPD